MRMKPYGKRYPHGTFRATVMFHIEICEARRIALIRFQGELTEQHFSALDTMAREQQGGEPFDIVFDMTEVTKVDIATEFIAKRGDLPPVFPESERLYAVPQEDLRVLTRLFAGYQAARGWRPPVVFETLDEALGYLGVTAADFRRVM
jgi:hypothetical protein